MAVHSPDQRHDNYLLWRFALNWNSLLNLNCRYLRNDMGPNSLSPYNTNGPITKDTKRILPALLRLHDYGILTTGIQPAKRTWSPIPTPAAELDRRAQELTSQRALTQKALEKDPVFTGDIDAQIKALQEEDEAALRTMAWITRRQRSYLTFLLPTVHAHIDPEAVLRFCIRLLNSPSIVTAYGYAYSPESPNKKRGRSKKSTFPEETRPARIWPGFEFRHNLPVEGEYSTSMMRTAATREGLVGGGSDAGVWEVEACGISSSGGLRHTLGDDEKEPFLASLAVDPLEIGVAARAWDSELDLLELVERLLKEEGFEPVFKQKLLTRPEDKY